MTMSRRQMMSGASAAAASLVGMPISESCQGALAEYASAGVLSI